LAYEPNAVKPEPKKVNLKRAFDPGSSPQQALIGGREGRKKHKGLQLFLSILARPRVPFTGKNALRALSRFASAAINARSVATMSQPLFGWVAQQSCG
jgi:hypothetical protein